jgi:hypothetical protein
MPTAVLQDIDERISHLARRPERPSVVPIAPHASPPPEGSVDSLGEADGESLEPPGELGPDVGLDDHVKVVSLHGEVKDADSAS